jgi:hypothetical protein
VTSENNMRKIIVAILFVIVVILGVNEISAQCRCAGIKREDGNVSRYVDAYDELENSKAVFIGEVSKVKKQSKPSKGNNSLGLNYEVTFKVEKAWKGIQGSSITIHSECLKEMGEKYLIYAKLSDKNTLQIRCCCTRTKRLVDAETDLKLFTERKLNFIELK